MMETLYKRDAKDNILVWRINKLYNGDLYISYGAFGKKQHTERIKPTLKRANELDSRIAAKRKEGYKSIRDLYDNSDIMANRTPVGTGSDFDIDLYNYLQTYLPKYNTTTDGFILPMLAKTLEDNKPFDKFGTLLGQWKINGLRCIIGAKVDRLHMFLPITLTYHSRTGEDWTNKLSFLDDIIFPKLKPDLVEMMIEEGVCLDGELYLPGYSVNDINSFVKNVTLLQHKNIQYWCYDLCMENASAKERNKLLIDNVNYEVLVHYNDKKSHKNNKQQFVVIPTVEVLDIQHAIDFRDTFIDIGFEGLILRNPDAEYAFGKRNQSMYKYKKKEDGLFEIIDIKEDKRGLPIYVLKNDINSELFECTINISQDKQREQLAIKDMLIGKKGLVEYRERSGVKQVPFHAKLIKIYV